MKRLTVSIMALCLVVLYSSWLGKTSASEAQAEAKIQIVSGPIPATKAPVNNFTGDVNVAMLSLLRDHLNFSSGYVNFAPGARTNWHSHPEGQMLIVTSGKGRVQQWGEPVLEIKEGDVVWFPAEVKHWHGAAPDQAMTHISMAPIVEGTSSFWMEEVTDDQYKGK